MVQACCVTKPLCTEDLPHTYHRHCLLPAVLGSVCSCAQSVYYQQCWTVSAPVLNRCEHTRLHTRANTAVVGPQRVCSPMPQHLPSPETLSLA